MCGIWGAVNVGNREAAEAAAKAMCHRGPDDHGIYIAHEPVPVALVNTRLAIIDLSPAGHMPMCNEDGRYWIAYNGEVYNFEPLREALLEAGHTFRSNSDTEVVLHAYQEWGEKSVELLRGMFAFAIWDTKEAKLFAARDRLGIKPFLYSFKRYNDDYSQLVFASELKALLMSGLVDTGLNYPAIHHYLSFYAVPAPYTMLRDVESLPPGHTLTYHKNKVTVKPYWSIPAIEPLELPEPEIREKLRALLEESIRLRMIADVPVGAFLSGGIDSSAVVALMTRISGERLKTFSIGFGSEGSSIDERSQARVLAEHYGTDHTEVIVTGRSVRDQITHIINAMDQPTGDGLNSYLVSQATGKHVKVALSGVGGDELFAGYPQFKMFQQIERASSVWNRMPNVAKQAARGTGSLIDPVRRAVHWLDGGLLERYERVRVLYNEAEKMALYTSKLSGWMGAPESSLDALSRYVHPAETDPIAKLTRLELHNYMSNTLLRDTDAMSMAHSLEVRVPLIDHKLVEFAVRIPPELKLRNGRTKWIFAEALRDILPAEVIDRPKRGFEMPVAAWMRGDLRDVVEDALSKESMERRGMFRHEVAQHHYQNFLNGEAPYLKVWSLVVLELWMRQFVDRRPSL